MKTVPIRADILSYAWECVDFYFGRPAAEYMRYPAADYHALVASVQGKMREAGYAQRLASSISSSLPAQYTLGRLYLRAARPNVEGQESVGWHREEFYGSPRGTLNFWMPVRGVTVGNSIQYIPDSDQIPDEDILIEREPDPVIEKGSAGNEIGLLYAPKHIVGGVDFTKAQPMVVPFGSAAIFSGSLIHGAAVNRGPEIRFSIDFRICPEA